MSTLLDELNPPQRQAAETLNGPLLVLAGAGSGKTRVLTYRIANLILEGEASPNEILAVTFTNKAAKEMLHRTMGLLKRMSVPVYNDLWVSTFHSTCARILRDEIFRLGYQPFFVIYDDSDQLTVLKRIVEEMNLNDKIYPPKMFKAQISNAKMLGIKPNEVAKKSFMAMDQTSIEVYQHYENELQRANALDFDDLLLKTYELYQKFPDVLAEYQQRFRYILVDEYQDTNHIQYLLIKLLASGHRNLCVVGDEDQSIYSWRGADISNILNFEKDFPEAVIVKLEENYRSTANIVEAASHVIRKNTQRKDKVLFTNNEAGSQILLQSEGNEYDEARFVARKVEEIFLRRTYSYNDFAIFYRTNAQSRVMEEQLRSYSIPYRLVGAVRFYDRAEIKDIICYMRLILNPSDDVAFARIINVPTRGIGKTTVDLILTMSSQKKITAVDAARETALQRLVHAGACNKINQFLSLYEELREEAKTAKVSDLYLTLLDKTGYANRLKEENTPEAQNRIGNLEELQNAIQQFEKERGEEANLTSFLEQLALVTDQDRLKEDQEAVTMMTLHLSKGLEYKNVFVVGMEEGLFPSSRSTDANDPTAVEEERRLCYVGMTRARENLFLSYARVRRVWGQEEHHQPSRFLKEIPPQYVTTSLDLNRPKFLDKYVSQFGIASDDDMAAHSRQESAYKKSPAQKFVRRRAAPEAQEAPSYEDFGDDAFDSSGSSDGALKKGDRVRHPIFGVGSIFQVEGDGDQQKVSVLFQDKSLKKFMTKHARLERV
jgi:DNA helicase II / ATP-dependent DNA helicase PcrA